MWYKGPGVEIIHVTQGWKVYWKLSQYFLYSWGMVNKETDNALAYFRDIQGKAMVITQLDNWGFY